MKRFQNFLMAVAASALAVVSCAKEEVAPETTISDDNVYEYLFTLGEADDTKATLNDKVVTWQEGDYLGVVCGYADGGYSYSNSNTKSEITPASGETPAKFLVKSYKALKTGGKVFCFFPYIDKQFTDPKITMSIPASQKNTINEMPMASIPFTVTEDVAAQTGTEVGDIKMVMLGSIARFKIYSANTDYQGETIKSVKFETASTDIAGSFNINIENIDFSNASTLAITLSDNKSTSITESVSDKTITDNKENGIVDMVIAPGTYSGTLTIVTNAASYEFTLSDKEFQRAHIKPFAVDLASENCTRTQETPELSVTWDLTKASYSEATDELVTWSDAAATMTNARGGSSNTKANNYLGGTNANTRTYSGNILSIAPGTGCEITKAVITATTESYANPINSNWTNATVSQNGAVLTVTPTDGNTSFSVKSTGTTRLISVQVFYKAVAQKTLTSIEISGTYPTEFNTGDEFSHDGMTVTALYDDESQKDVTADAEFSGYDMGTPGNQTVTVSYTEVTTTRTATYGITVTAAPIILAEDIEDAPAVGGEDLEHSYTAQYFTTDDVEVADVTGQVYEAIAMDGDIVYTLLPNYTTAKKEGTIVLQSASNHNITKTINVSQKSSGLNVSTTEITIPYNETSASFTLTSKEFGWNLAITPASGMNLTTDKSSGESRSSAQTVTISSTTEASDSEVLTLGTIVVYRNGNTSDSQKKTITVKKGQDPGSASAYYKKVTSVTSGKKYIFVSTYSGTKYILSGIIASKSLTVTGASALIVNNQIASTDQTNVYAVEISGSDGSYSLTNSNNMLLTVDKGDIKEVDSSTQKWTITQHTDGSFKFVNSSQSTRALFIGNKGASCKNYATSNFGNTDYANTYFELYELDE